MGSGMSIPIFTSIRHASRYNLLDAMAAELGDAFRRAGFAVNPPIETLGPGDPSIHVFFNFPPSFDQLAEWCGLGRRRVALIQYFVDHPLALDAGLMEMLSQLPNYRLLAPCLDDVHLLHLRWPGLRVVHCPHGVPPSAICEPSPDTPRPEREIDLLVTGWIHAPEEIAALRETVPAALRPGADAVVELMLEHPWVSFGQALDLCLPNGLVTNRYWTILQLVWRFTTASLNRERRTRLVAGMQGIATHVFGPESWRSICTGSICYRGEAPYSSLASIMASARVCLAWSPTQFVHSTSERVLLSMASGAATLTDDRLASRVLHAAGCVELYDAENPGTARAAAQRLLSDPERRSVLASTAVERVRRDHLWDHRLGLFMQVAGHALAAPVGSGLVAA